MKTQLNRIRSLALLASGIGIAQSLFTGAVAQTDGAAPGGNGATMIETITVTAMRRSENVETVPLAITAVSGKELSERGLNTISDLVQVVPSAQVSSQAGSNQVTVTLRGIGLANQFNANAASPVGVYMDDIYQAFRAAPGVQQFDLDRVEVLRGPQGTLFGRNTTGGAIDFISASPLLDGATNGYVDLSYGNYNAVKAEGAGTVALIPDELAMRVSYQHVQNDGYIKNLGTAPNEGSNHSDEGRVQFHYVPTDKLDVELKLYGGQSSGIVPTMTFPMLPGNVDILGYSRAGLQNYQVRTNFPAPIKLKTAGADLHVTWDLGAVQLTSITAFDYGQQFLQFDVDGTPNTLVNSRYNLRGRQVNQEFRLNYSTDDLDVVVGTNFGWDDMNYVSSVAFTTTFISNNYNQARRSFAPIFGEVTYKFSDEFSLAGGLRYTIDNISLYQLLTSLDSSFAGPGIANIIPGPGPFDPTNFYPTQNRQTSGLTGRAIAKYQFDPNIMAYASVSHGYRAGQFNGTQFFSTDDISFVPPEKVWTYELGLKGEIADNFILNAALYYNDLTGQQVLTQPLIPGVVTTQLEGLNGHSYGFELEGVWQAFENLTLTGNVGVIRSRYDNGQFVDNVPVGGLKFPLAPDVTALAQFDWKAWSDGDQSLTLNASGNYMGHYFYDPTDGTEFKGANITGGSQPYWLLDARLTYTINRYSIALWGKNLTDAFYLPYGSGGLETFGLDYMARGEPRTFGIEARVSF